MGPERRIGSFHAVANAIALGLQSASWWTRRSGSRRRGAALSIAAFATTGVAGWLGGHLAHALGVGVDTTVFQHLPGDWTDTVDASDVGDGLVRHDVDGVPIVMFRDDGRIVALADRCTHRGGPLHEGTLDNGCVTCPWHGSVFDADGNVRSGPATRPQPRLDVRIVDGRVQVRMQSERTLRTNPVGR
jgi:nitrite reductase/ring-hydroxylating ferredoxin subunit